MIKHIFVYWDSGWENAPEICKACLQSWKLLNPSWNVITLDEKNLPKYVPTATIREFKKFKPIQCYTDLVRLFLVYKFGGLYVDATMYCNIALDEWLTHKRLVKNIWVCWDIDSVLSNINFLYSGRKLSPLFNLEIDKVNPNGGYHKINRAFFGLLKPISNRLKQKQVGISSNNSRPKKGGKIIANDFSLMNSKVDNRFLQALKEYPFFKLTWKYNQPEKPLHSVFKKNSKLMHLVTNTNQYGANDSIDDAS